MANYFMPSEVARLILGYLIDRGLSRTMKTFLQECPDLAEFYQIMKTGRVPPTTIMGQGLLDILNEFAELKLKNIRSGQIKVSTVTATECSSRERDAIISGREQAQEAIKRQRLLWRERKATQASARKAREQDTTTLAGGSVGITTPVSSCRHGVSPDVPVSTPRYVVIVENTAAPTSSTVTHPEAVSTSILSYVPSPGYTLSIPSHLTSPEIHSASTSHHVTSPEYTDIEPVTSVVAEVENMTDIQTEVQGIPAAQTNLDTQIQVGLGAKHAAGPSQAKAAAEENADLLDWMLEDTNFHEKLAENINKVLLECDSSQLKNGVSTLSEKHNKDLASMISKGFNINQIIERTESDPSFQSFLQLFQQGTAIPLTQFDVPVINISSEVTTGQSGHIILPTTAKDNPSQAAPQSCKSAPVEPVHYQCDVSAGAPACSVNFQPGNLLHTDAKQTLVLNSCDVDRLDQELPCTIDTLGVSETRQVNSSPTLKQLEAGDSYQQDGADPLSHNNLSSKFKVIEEYGSQNLIDSKLTSSLQLGTSGFSQTCVDSNLNSVLDQVVILDSAESKKSVISEICCLQGSSLPAEKVISRNSVVPHSENSLTVFSLIEKSIAEMNGEEFVHRSKRNSPSSQTAVSVDSHSSGGNRTEGGEHLSTVAVCDNISKEDVCCEDIVKNSINDHARTEKCQDSNIKTGSDSIEKSVSIHFSICATQNSSASLTATAIKENVGTCQVGSPTDARINYPNEHAVACITALPVCEKNGELHPAFDNKPGEKNSELRPAFDNKLSENGLNPANLCQNDCTASKTEQHGIGMEGNSSVSDAAVSISVGKSTRVNQEETHALFLQANSGQAVIGTHETCVGVSGLKNMCTELGTSHSLPKLSEQDKANSTVSPDKKNNDNSCNSVCAENNKQCSRNGGQNCTLIADCPVVRETGKMEDMEERETSVCVPDKELCVDNQEPFCMSPPLRKPGRQQQSMAHRHTKKTCINKQIEVQRSQSLCDCSAASNSLDGQNTTANGNSVNPVITSLPYFPLNVTDNNIHEQLSASIHPQTSSSSLPATLANVPAPGSPNFSQSCHLSVKQALEMTPPQGKQLLINSTEDNQTQPKTVKRRVIAFHSEHSPFIPDHCKKNPSRRIAPKEVDYSTPSPLQDCPSSPMSYMVDVSVSQPNSPLNSKEGVLRPLTSGKTQPPLNAQIRTNPQRSIEAPCHNEKTSSCSGAQPQTTQGQHKVKTPDVCLSHLVELGIKLPPSPSKRKPRRITPVQLSSVNKDWSGVTRSSSFIPHGGYSPVVDESRIVSSTSDITTSSEEEAFRLLKSFLSSSYSKPQPRQEITSTYQKTGVSKSVQTSRSHSKQKGRGQRTPPVKETAVLTTSSEANESSISEEHVFVASDCASTRGGQCSAESVPSCEEPVNKVCNSGSVKGVSAVSLSYSKENLPVKNIVYKVQCLHNAAHPSVSPCSRDSDMSFAPVGIMECYSIDSGKQVQATDNCKMAICSSSSSPGTVCENTHNIPCMAKSKDKSSKESSNTLYVSGELCDYQNDIGGHSKVCAETHKKTPETEHMGVAHSGLASVDVDQASINPTSQGKAADGHCLPAGVQGAILVKKPINRVETKAVGLCRNVSALSDTVTLPTITVAANRAENKTVIHSPSIVKSLSSTSASQEHHIASASQEHHIASASQEHHIASASQEHHIASASQEHHIASASQEHHIASASQEHHIASASQEHHIASEDSLILNTTGPAVSRKCQVTQMQTSRPHKHQVSNGSCPSAQSPNKMLNVSDGVTDAVYSLLSLCSSVNSKMATNILSLSDENLSSNIDDNHVLATKKFPMNNTDHSCDHPSTAVPMSGSLLQVPVVTSDVSLPSFISSSLRLAHDIEYTSEVPTNCPSSPLEHCSSHFAAQGANRSSENVHEVHTNQDRLRPCSPSSISLLSKAMTDSGIPFDGSNLTLLDTWANAGDGVCNKSPVHRLQAPSVLEAANAHVNTESRKGRKARSKAQKPNHRNVAKIVPSLGVHNFELTERYEVEDPVPSSSFVKILPRASEASNAVLKHQAMDTQPKSSSLGQIQIIPSANGPIIIIPPGLEGIIQNLLSENNTQSSQVSHTGNNLPVGNECMQPSNMESIKSLSTSVNENISDLHPSMPAVRKLQCHPQSESVGLEVVDKSGSCSLNKKLSSSSSTNILEKSSASWHAAIDYDGKHKSDRLSLSDEVQLPRASNFKCARKIAVRRRIDFTNLRSSSRTKAKKKRCKASDVADCVSPLNQGQSSNVIVASGIKGRKSVSFIQVPGIKQTVKNMECEVLLKNCTDDAAQSEQTEVIYEVKTQGKDSVVQSDLEDGVCEINGQHNDFLLDDRCNRTKVSCEVKKNLKNCPAQREKAGTEVRRNYTDYAGKSDKAPVLCDDKKSSNHSVGQKGKPGLVCEVKKSGTDKNHKRNKLSVVCEVKKSGTGDAGQKDKKGAVCEIKKSATTDLAAEYNRSSKIVVSCKETGKVDGKGDNSRSSSGENMNKSSGNKLLFSGDKSEEVSSNKCISSRDSTKANHSRITVRKSTASNMPVLATLLHGRGKSERKRNVGDSVEIIVCDDTSEQRTGISVHDHSSSTLKVKSSDSSKPSKNNSQVKAANINQKQPPIKNSTEDSRNSNNTLPSSDNQSTISISDNLHTMSTLTVPRQRKRKETHLGDEQSDSSFKKIKLRVPIDKPDIKEQHISAIKKSVRMVVDYSSGENIVVGNVPSENSDVFNISETEQEKEQCHILQASTQLRSRNKPAVQRCRSKNSINVCNNNTIVNKCATEGGNTRLLENKLGCDGETSAKPGECQYVGSIPFRSLFSIFDTLHTQGNQSSQPSLVSVDGTVKRSPKHPQHKHTENPSVARKSHSHTASRHRKTQAAAPSKKVIPEQEQTNTSDSTVAGTSRDRAASQNRKYNKSAGSTGDIGRGERPGFPRKQETCNRDNETHTASLVDVDCASSNNYDNETQDAVSALELCMREATEYTHHFHKQPGLLCEVSPQVNIDHSAVTILEEIICHMSNTSSPTKKSQPCHSNDASPIKLHLPPKKRLSSEFIVNGTVDVQFQHDHNSSVLPDNDCILSVNKVTACWSHPSNMGPSEVLQDSSKLETASSHIETDAACREPLAENSDLHSSQPASLDHNSKTNPLSTEDRNKTTDSCPVPECHEVVHVTSVSEVQTIQSSHSSLIDNSNTSSLREIGKEQSPLSSSSLGVQHKESSTSSSIVSLDKRNPNKRGYDTANSELTLEVPSVNKCEPCTVSDNKVTPQTTYIPSADPAQLDETHPACKHKMENKVDKLLRKLHKKKKKHV